MNKINNDIDIRLSHVMGYIKAMVPKNNKTMQDSYPVEMNENQKDYIIKHLEAIRNETFSGI